MNRAVLASPLPAVHAYAGGRLTHGLLVLACFLWGTSQVAPEGSALDFSIGWLSAGDVVFLLATFMLFASEQFREHARQFLQYCRVFTLLVVGFAALGLISSFLNSYTRDIQFNDLIEVLRPAYYLVVVIVLSHVVRTTRVSTIALAYAIGIVLATVSNLLVVLSGDGPSGPEGLFVLVNPNVTGHMLAVAILLGAIALHDGRPRSGLLVAIASTALVVFTFSKGAWLMTVISLAALAFVYRKRKKEGALRRTGATLLVWGTIAGTVTVAVIYAALVGAALEFKLQQSVASDTERSESSLALRAGHILSSLEMTAYSPVTGVGVTNWQSENDRNAYWLNDVFLVNDNPHNGFFYVLSGMGIPALVTFAAIMLFPVMLVPHVFGYTRDAAVAIRLLLFALLLLSGNVMQHIVSHYYFWILCGLVFGCALRNLPWPRTPQAARLRTSSPQPRQLPSGR